MSVVYGIPTVIGGIREGVFLSSLEQFDKSSSSWNVPLQRDWRVINHALNAPRYEMAVASIPISRVKVKKRESSDQCEEGGSAISGFRGAAAERKNGGFGIWDLEEDDDA